MNPDWRRGTLRLLTITTLGVLMMGSSVFAQTRRPAVAGSFYPADADELRREVLAYLDTSERGTTCPKAIIVPHAGYVFSGATAGRAFASLVGATVSRVVLLGPSHHASFSGAALPAPGMGAFSTPLGDMPLDHEVVERLRRARGFDGPARAHDAEHCLEVELPFLQVTVGNVPIVPILIGHGTDEVLARSLARELAGILDDKTIVVVSSDFTHHGAAYGYAPFGSDRHTAATLIDLAKATAGRAAAVDERGFWQQVEVSGDTVCGARPIDVLLELLKHAFEGRGRVVGVSTSAEVSGDWRQIVAYAAVAHTGRWVPWHDGSQEPQLGELNATEKAAATSLARATLQTHLTHQGQLANWFAGHDVGGNLRAPAGVFVTLNTKPPQGHGKGQLRGCIGTLEAREPLVDAIIHAAVSAAHDPRFPALGVRELDGITVEVSVLSPLRRVPGPEAIELGKHGVLLGKDGRQAVFLPQVGRDYGWDLDTFLTQLSLKAGLAPTAWRHGATFEVFTAQVFGEDE